MGEMIVISMTIIALALITGMSLNGIVEKVMSTKRLRHQTNGGAAPEDIRQIAERQQMIEDRLRVIERITTDANSGDVRVTAQIAAEIEALRALPAAAPSLRKDLSE